MSAGHRRTQQSVSIKRNSPRDRFRDGNQNN